MLTDKTCPKCKEKKAHVLSKIITRNITFHLYCEKCGNKSENYGDLHTLKNTEWVEREKPDNSRYWEGRDDEKFAILKYLKEDLSFCKSRGINLVNPVVAEVAIETIKVIIEHIENLEHRRNPIE